MKTNQQLEQLYPNQLRYLQKLLKSGKMGGAVLFIGDPNGPQEQFAIWLVEQLLHDRTHRQRSRVHPDLFEIGNEQNAASISVQEAQNLRLFLSIKPQQSAVRVAVIHNADKLTLSASNALLKSIEEPAPHAVIILHSAHPELLPKTVLSRLQVLRFAHHLTGAEPVHTNDEDSEQVEFWLRFLRSPIAERESLLQDWLQQSEKSSNKQRDVCDALTTIQHLLRDQLLAKQHVHSGRQFYEHATVLDNLAQHQTTELIFKKLSITSMLRTWTTQNVNKKMTLEYLSSIL